MVTSERSSYACGETCFAEDETVSESVGMFAAMPRRLLCKPSCAKDLLLVLIRGVPTRSAQMTDVQSTLTSDVHLCTSCGSMDSQLDSVMQAAP